MAQVIVEFNSEELGALDSRLFKGQTRESYCHDAVVATWQPAKNLAAGVAAKEAVKAKE